MAAPFQRLLRMKSFQEIVHYHYLSRKLCRVSGNNLHISAKGRRCSRTIFPLSNVGWNISTFSHQNQSRQSVLLKQCQCLMSSNAASDIEGKHSHIQDRQCWKCDRLNGNQEELFFCRCGFIQKVPNTVNFFDVFRIKPMSFQIDLKKMAADYIKFQQLLHPDKYVGKTEIEMELSDALSSLVNHAYKILQKPLTRGLYLLELHGDPLEEGTQVTDPEFLMEIMEVNETIAGKISETEARKIWRENSAVLDDLIGKVSQAFEQGDIIGAKKLLTKMKYFSNITDKLKESQLTEGWQLEDYDI